MSEILANTISSRAGAVPAAALSVEMIGDVVCPFTFLGKRRLDTALEAVKGPAEVSWYPWQLNPELPAEGMAFEDYLAQRFGSAKVVQPALDGLRREGRDAGIEFNFDRIKRIPNTLLAHQLLYVAETKGKDAVALADTLMSAFLERGEDIGDPEVLASLATAHGIRGRDVIAIEDDKHSREAVMKCERQVRASGISGVPGFLLNRRLLVVGAQEVDAIINAFDRAMFGEGTDDVVSPALN